MSKRSVARHYAIVYRRAAALETNPREAAKLHNKARRELAAEQRRKEQLSLIEQIMNRLKGENDANT